MSEVLPEIYREIDESPVTWGDAMHAWAPLAQAALLAAAEVYHGTITAEQLADYVQQVSGIRTSDPVETWLPRLLSRVAKRALADRLPPISSLCVNDDGTVFDRYSSWIQLPGFEPPAANADAHAALDRLTCYQQYAGDLPVDGGVPGPMPQVIVNVRTKRTPNSAGAARRSAGPAKPRAAASSSKPRGIDAAKARRKAEAEPPRVCSICNMQLPSSGVCDLCG